MPAQRESGDRQKLVALRHAVRELAATPLTEALRRHEPVSLGRVATQSIQAKYNPPGAAAAPVWRPWARGTAAHAALQRLVAGTGQAGDAAGDAAQAEHGGAFGSQPQVAAAPEPRAKAPAMEPAEAATLEGEEAGGSAAKRARVALT